MDHIVADAERWAQMEEDISYLACIEVAEHNGLTRRQAESCEVMKDNYGRFRCNGCPWAPTATDKEKSTISGLVTALIV